MWECIAPTKMGHFARGCRDPRIKGITGNSGIMKAIEATVKMWIRRKKLLPKPWWLLMEAGFMTELYGDDSIVPNQTLASLHAFQTLSYNVVPPPPTGLFSPPNLYLSYSGLKEFQQPEFEGYGPKFSKSVSEDISNEVKESPDDRT
ncbi:hypothetical protein Tco_0184192 [Tanacetum coccineum]